MEAEPSPARPREPRGAARAAPRSFPDPPQRILLVSIASPIYPDVIQTAINLASPEHAKITVLGLARVFGTAFGLPNPMLQPTRREWDAQRGHVDEAAKILRRKGFDVRVALARARNAPKMIARWGTAKNFHAIVVADPDRPRWRRTIEGDLAHDIERRCGIPVHAVPVPAPSHRRSWAG